MQDRLKRLKEYLKNAILMDDKEEIIRLKETIRDLKKQSN
jgi:protein-arginine kinase activator protein McsA